MSDLCEFDMLRSLTLGCVSVAASFERHQHRFFCLRVNNREAARRCRLTERQSQISALAVRGLSNKHIAFTLGLSLSSVATHLARSTRKLGRPGMALLSTLARVG